MHMYTVFMFKIRDNAMRTLDNEICIEALERSKTSADNAQETMTCLFFSCYCRCFMNLIAFDI